VAIIKGNINEVKPRDDFKISRFQDFKISRFQGTYGWEVSRHEHDPHTDVTDEPKKIA